MLYSLKGNKTRLERGKEEITLELDTSKKKVEEELDKVEVCVVAAEYEVASTQVALNTSLAREAALKEKVEFLKSQTYKDEIPS